MNIDLNKVQRFLDWLKTQLYLDTLVVNASRRVVKRGQVYRCNFGMGIGSEMQKERPAVIVQNSIGNLKSGNTIVIPITHDTSTLPCVAVITTQYEADGTTTKLDGQANASNIMCVSKSRLGTYICDLPASDMKKVDEALAKTMGLIGYYADLNKKLSDKLTYISKIKAERNTAQDTLKEIYSVLGLEETGDTCFSDTIWMASVSCNLLRQALHTVIISCIISETYFSRSDVRPKFIFVILFKS